jgi:hypothetical protein
MTELEAHWLLTGMKVSGSSSKQAKGEGFSMLQHIPCHGGVLAGIAGKRTKQQGTVAVAASWAGYWGCESHMSGEQ